VVDRDFDAHVKRTAHRVVATGQVSPKEALLVGAVLAGAAGLLLLPLNRATFLFALVALAVAACYPLFKRFFPLPQAWLGIAFSFGIPMAFAPCGGGVPPLGWVIFIGNMFWVMAYDTEYAMVDREDDLKIGIQSSAILFGRRRCDRGDGLLRGASCGAGGNRSAHRCELVLLPGFFARRQRSRSTTTR